MKTLPGYQLQIACSKFRSILRRQPGLQQPLQAGDLIFQFGLRGHASRYIADVSALKKEQPAEV